MNRLVHLNALRAFEASARHQSFSAAAQELHVTPAAVGQLVRTLEDWLGAPLFARVASGRARLLPTDAALRALPDIRTGFEQLAHGLQRLRQQDGATLTVTISPAFAAKWLLPRIDRFHAAHPDVALRLDTSHHPVKAADFVARRIDVGVRYGSGRWPGLRAEHLMDEDVWPVGSIDWLRRNKLRKPADLTQHPLIHDLSMDSHPDFPTWQTWFAHAGVADIPKNAPKPASLNINNSAAVLQLVMEGHGVALARSRLAHDDVASGRLARLFEHINLPSPLAYYVVYRPECAEQPALAAFRQWLAQEARQAHERATRFA